MRTNLNVSVDGANVVYDRSDADGHPIIFVHGGFGSSSELWHTTIENLPKGISGYAINNFLRSDAPPGGFTIQSFATRVAHFAQALGLDRPIIVGHSMGGVVCQAAAIAYPEVFGGVVLIGTGPTMRNHITGKALLERLRSEPMSEQLMRDISAKWFLKDPPEGFFEAYVERALQAPREGMIEIQASLLETDLVADLNKITVPALILHPLQDSGRPIEHARMLNEGISGSRLHVFDECGHSPMLESKEEFESVFHPFVRDVFSPETAA